MRQISIENSELIGRGVTASVYALDAKRIVKVFRSIVPEKEIEEEYYRANLVNSLGIPTPAALEIVRCGNETGIVYDRIHGRTLAEEIKRHPGDYFEYGERYGRIVHELHSRHVPDAPIPQAESFMEGLFDNTQGLIPDDEKEELIAFLRLVPEADCLLHGDISPVNIMVEDDELIIIDVPTVGKGHPVFDLLQPYAYCKMTPELYERYLSLPEDRKQSPAGRFMARFGDRYIGSDGANQIWDGFFRGYFGGQPKAEKADVECLLRFYNAIKLMGSVYMRGKFDDEVVRYLVNEGREEVNSLGPAAADLAASLLAPEVYV